MKANESDAEIRFGELFRAAMPPPPSDADPATVVDDFYAALADMDASAGIPPPPDAAVRAAAAAKKAALLRSRFLRAAAAAAAAVAVASLGVRAMQRSDVPESGFRPESAGTDPRPRTGRSQAFWGVSVSDARLRTPRPDFSPRMRFSVVR